MIHLFKTLVVASRLPAISVVTVCAAVTFGAVVVNSFDLVDGTWSDGFGSPGMVGSVTSIGEDNAHIWVAGTGWIGGARIDGAARYEKDMHVWHDAGSFNGSINSFVSAPGGLLAAGSFSSIDGIEVHGLALWSGEGWSEFLGGAEGDVRCLDVAGDSLLIGGDLQRVGGEVEVSQVALWDGAMWLGLEGGTDGQVADCHILTSGQVVVGGRFKQAGAASVSNVAVWDGATWDSLDGGVDGIHSTWIARLLPLSSDSLIVAGRFDTAGGIDARTLALWTGETWTGLLGDDHSILVADQLASSESDILLGSEFTLYKLSNGDSLTVLLDAGGKEITSLYSFSDGKTGVGMRMGAVPTKQITDRPIGDFLIYDPAGSWDILGSETMNGITGAVCRVESDGSAAYIFGDLQFLGLEPAISSLYKWTGRKWQALDDREGRLSAIEADAQSSTLYSVFSGITPESNWIVSRRVADTWEDLASFDGMVSYISAAGDILVVAGPFDSVTNSDGITLPANGISIRQDDLWSALGEGLSGTVTAVSIVAGKPYVAVASGAYERVVKMWDGSEWVQVGDLLVGGGIDKIVDYGGKVVLLGDLYGAASDLSTTVADLQDERWVQLGDGPPGPQGIWGYEYGREGELWVGGSVFIDGTWESVIYTDPQGIRPVVTGIARLDDTIFFGGSFTEVGSVSDGIARVPSVGFAALNPYPLLGSPHEQPVRNPEVTAYPNPFQSRVVLDMSRLNGLMRVEAFDISGRRVLLREATKGALEIDTSGWAPGLYFFSFAGPDQSGVLPGMCVR